MHTNKYCNDVCDFFYAALYKSSRPYCCSCLCSAPPAAYQFIEISLGPATTTWHSTRAKFVEKICNIRFNEVTTWQRKKRVIKNMLEKINKQSTAEMYLKKKKKKHLPSLKAAITSVSSSKELATRVRQMEMRWRWHFSSAQPHKGSLCGWREQF